jgi:glycerol uptake facilitator-like aquaporin
MCKEINKEGKFCIGIFCIFASLLITGCLLIGLGMGKEDEQPSETGKQMMFAGLIILLVIFIGACTGIVVNCNRDGRSDDLFGPA